MSSTRSAGSCVLCHGDVVVTTARSSVLSRPKGAQQLIYPKVSSLHLDLVRGMQVKRRVRSNARALLDMADTILKSEGRTSTVEVGQSSVCGNLRNESPQRPKTPTIFRESMTERSRFAVPVKAA
jgi:hypothetical protein